MRLEIGSRIGVLAKSVLLITWTTTLIAQSVTVVDVPNARYVFLSTINDSGDAAGTLTDLNNKQHGFVRDSSGNVTIFDAPNAYYTSPVNINSGGDVIGWFVD